MSSYEENGQYEGPLDELYGEGSVSAGPLDEQPTAQDPAEDVLESLKDGKTVGTGPGLLE